VKENLVKRHFAVVALILTALALAATAQNTSQSRQADESNAVEHGRYLVHHVAQCVQCHTPRDERGVLDERRPLEGARIPVASPYPNLPWAFSSPKIAGLPGWSDEEALALLTRGKRPNAPAPRGPMPKFQMTDEDARSVVAYLKSLR
jgi:mono/diheme cytochrome c family protein